MHKIKVFPLIFICFVSAFSQAQSIAELVENTPLTQDTVKAIQQELDSSVVRLRNYFYESNYEKVIEEAPRLINTSDSIGYYTASTRLRGALGNSFIQIDEFDKADQIFNRALIEAKKRKDTFDILASYNNLGNTYIISNPQKSIEYIKQGMDVLDLLDLLESYPYGNLMGFMFNNNLSELYVGIKDSENATYYSNKALAILNSPEGIGQRQEEAFGAVYFVQGNIKLIESDPSGAIEVINKSLEIAGDKLDENYLLGNYKNLIDAYDKTNNLKKLNEVRKVYDSLRDKRYEAEKIRQQQIAKSKYNIDKYEQELRESHLKTKLSEQKATQNKMLFNFTAIISSIMVILIALLLFARFKRNALLKDLKIKNKQYLEAKDKSEKLAQSNTRFLSTISHELRTPLYGIIGLSSVLLKNTKAKEDQEHIESLKFSADYLLALVNDVLNINKFRSNEGRILKEDHFILKNLIESIVQSFEFINKKNNNRVHISLDPNLPKVVLGDKMKISQVLMNLISNASKFTEDGEIFVTINGKNAGENKVAITFCIKDSGPGIPKEEQRKIFEEFTQLRKGEDQQGTGLGLPIVNRILDILGSKLNFKSEIGKGTEFSFELIFKPGLESELKININDDGIELLLDKKILIVDDNKINQLVTQKVLEQNGMKHHCANNGLEAVEIVGKTNFDAILMDINMPVLNGIDASKKIREFNKNVPIIALTATNYDHLDSTLFDSGIDDAIVKPYDTEQLLALLLKHAVRPTINAT